MSSAAGLVGAALFVSTAIIEVARAWTAAPRVGAEASQVVGGLVVALFVVAAFGLATRLQSLGGVAVAAAFALVAHGGSLVLDGDTVGALFLGLAPIAAMLTNVSLERGNVLLEWKNRKTARVAAPAASRTPLNMRASQVTIIDA